jgi:adenosine deaminase
LRRLCANCVSRQTKDALERVAYEQAEDLSRDGVVYFETRFAPVFHTRRRLSHQRVVAAVLKGLDNLRDAQHERVALSAGGRILASGRD